MKRARPHPRARWPWLVAALALALAGGCGGDNTLWGSVSELFSLQVSRVEILRNGVALHLRYYLNRATEVDLVARVTVATPGVVFDGGGRLKLEGEYAPGHPTTTAIHLAGGEPTRALPWVKKGDLVVSAGGEVGDLTRGNFSMSFADGDFGGGRTLYGNFSGVAKDAGF